MWFILGVIVLFIILYAYTQSKGGMTKVYSDKGFTLIDEDFFVDYCGGLKNISKDNHVKCIPMEEGLLFSILFTGQGRKENKLIKWNK